MAKHTLTDSNGKILFEYPVDTVLNYIISDIWPNICYYYESYYPTKSTSLHFDFEDADKIWMAAMKNDFDTMKLLYNNNNNIGLNVQQQYKDSYIHTALDWAIRHNNKEMIQWLCERDAWSFSHTVYDFSERFPDLKQKYNGRDTYHFWYAAERNNFTAMNEKHTEKVSVNLIRSGKTMLDSAVINNNKEMANYLISHGAKLCSVTVEDFNKKFEEYITNI